LMNCWNFGNMLSLTTELAGDLAWSPQPADLDQALLNLATRHFGRQAAATVVEGWKLLSEAMEDFPGSIPVLYNGPVNRGPVLPFLLDKVNKSFPHSWLPDLDIEGDDLNSWVSPFGPDQVIKSFRSLAERWQKGVDVMRSALDLASGADRAALQKELGVAQFCALQFRCAANITEFYVTRDRYHDTENPNERQASKQKMIALMKDEQQNCQDALTLVEADPRLGFHGEAYTYLVTSDGIRAKLEQLKQAVEALRLSSLSH
ncbi:MAG: hypothetical protein HY318_06755, partial [Armatimonadetes bacterium]|nr:hypothetical protein [Armatimonadota bacterium]